VFYTRGDPETNTTGLPPPAASHFVVRRRPLAQPRHLPATAFTAMRCDACCGQTLGKQATDSQQVLLISCCAIDPGIVLLLLLRHVSRGALCFPSLARTPHRPAREHAAAPQVRDRGNCTPRAMRSTLGILPSSREMLRQGAMPLALCITPLATPEPDDDPVPVRTCPPPDKTHLTKKAPMSRGRQSACPRSAWAARPGRASGAVATQACGVPMVQVVDVGPAAPLRAGGGLRARGRPPRRCWTSGRPGRCAAAAARRT